MGIPVLQICSNIQTNKQINQSFLKLALQTNTTTIIMITTVQTKITLLSDVKMVCFVRCPFVLLLSYLSRTNPQSLPSTLLRSVFIFSVLLACLLIVHISGYFNRDRPVY